MDSPAVTHIFRQLLAIPSRKCLRLQSYAASRKALNAQQRRSYALRRNQDDAHGGSRWQQRIDAFPKDMSKQLREYPKVTSFDLRNRLHHPRRVKMLARDFFEGQQGHWNPCCWLIHNRQSVQSQLWILLASCHYLQSRRTFRFSFD